MKITLKSIEGHIILYCKGHYNVESVDFLTGLRRIWSIRCGYDYRKEDKSADRYIANELFSLFKLLSPKKAEYFHEILHYDLESWRATRYKDLTFLETLIMVYRSEIWNIQIKEKQKVKYSSLIKLPKPQKRLFKRIVKGKGDYNDYKLIK
jgi:hypothetical protein